MLVKKRNGQFVPHDPSKIDRAVGKACIEVGEEPIILGDLNVKTHNNNDGELYINIEDIQDAVEIKLMSVNPIVAQAYIRYRHTRMLQRNTGADILRDLDKITNMKAVENESGRDNANVNEDAPMGWMLHAGETATKTYFKQFQLKKSWRAAHDDALIHIHDLGWYGRTINCLQNDVEMLMSRRVSDEDLECKFKEEFDKYQDPNIAGALTHKYELDNSTFSTGHGSIRNPKTFRTAMSITAVIIQANQNDNFGGQGVPNIDYQLERFVHQDFIKEVEHALVECLYIAGKLTDKDNIKSDLKEIKNPFNTTSDVVAVVSKYAPQKVAERVVEIAYTNTIENINQACEGFIHNLNSMSSRAGAQVPFSSITFGMNTRESGRVITKGLLQAQLEGLGQGETPIFPISIFVTKEGVNCLPGDPNYDLYQFAMKVSAKRLFPTYIFLDCPINLKYYKPDQPRTFTAQMGCRTRVQANVNGEETSYGRGNLSATTLNLAGIALNTLNQDTRSAEGLIADFYGNLDSVLAICEEQLMDRYKRQCSLHGYNLPMTIGEGLYMGSKDLKLEDTIEPALKNGTLVIGTCGLAECLVALTGKHHGEDMKSQKLGLEIYQHIRNFTDSLTEKYHLNWATFGSPSESTSGRFLAIDRKKYGIIPGITDKEYYTNSSHVPVGFEVSAFDKISIEAPYHVICTAGHICYIEFDSDISNNIEAYETVLAHMRHSGVQYGAVNVPVDRCGFCNYTGIIETKCPMCGYESQGYYDENIHRIRRITGYLTGDVHNRFNDSKKAEERDRVKHRGISDMCAL